MKHWLPILLKRICSEELSFASKNLFSLKPDTQNDWGLLNTNFDKKKVSPLKFFLLHCTETKTLHIQINPSNIAWAPTSLYIFSSSQLCYRVVVCPPSVIFLAPVSVSVYVSVSGPCNCISLIPPLPPPHQPASTYRHGRSISRSSDRVIYLTMTRNCPSLISEEVCKKQE